MLDDAVSSTGIAIGISDAGGCERWCVGAGLLVWRRDVAKRLRTPV